MTNVIQEFAGRGLSETYSCERQLRLLAFQEFSLQVDGDGIWVRSDRRRKDFWRCEDVRRGVRTGGKSGVEKDGGPDKQT